MKPRLVIADDEADIRRLIVFLLRSYDLSEAQNGKRALELIRETQPDLVLLDVMMPEMTGLQVLDAVHRDPLSASIPIILLSAKGQVTEIEQGLQSGATRYLVKPFEPQALRGYISDNNPAFLEAFQQGRPAYLIAVDDLITQLQSGPFQHTEVRLTAVEEVADEWYSNYALVQIKAMQAGNFVGPRSEASIL